MNDPRTTAYALNELQGADREKFESDLATDQRLQRDLLVTCEMTDALGEVTEEPGEGLEPRAKERLLREIIANQEAFRTRRKIVRFAVPVSLAAAASIAVLLWVTGGKTMQEPAIAAARAPEGRNDPGAPQGFSAKAIADRAPVTFTGTGTLSIPDGRPASLSAKENGQGEFVVSGLRTVFLSENAKTLQRESNLAPPDVRQRSLLTSEEIPLWGSGDQ